MPILSAFHGDYAGYAIPILGSLVEATYLFAGGECREAGPPKKNAAGHFIMWTETLARV